MAFKIHHAVAKKAKRLGIDLTPTVDGVDVEATKDGEVLATATTASEALLKAEKVLAARANEGKPAKAPKPRKVRDEDDEEFEDEDEQEDADEFDAEIDDPEDDEEGDDEDEGRSKVKKKYKRAYKPTKNKNGDELGFLITDHVAERDEQGNIAKPLRLDADKLENFARANGVWKADYNNLNIGMRRMNIGNRLRAKLKKGDFEIVWA